MLSCDDALSTVAPVDCSRVASINHYHYFTNPMPVTTPHASDSLHEGAFIAANTQTHFSMLTALRGSQKKCGAISAMKIQQPEHRLCFLHFRVVPWTTSTLPNVPLANGFLMISAKPPIALTQKPCIGAPFFLLVGNEKIPEERSTDWNPNLN